ncbi:Retrovirus-related Pol polyprotein from transposon RE1 [Vitis vinifera]|uniref:Retrovirus-related Pol polyprotein from transposon RE1 n=1 Tax=Vitis vinifera TaxID=29760 RepID=A0A438H8P3_VITVI|nr:Retrovirus-related Pol polyprotein from transposon RE1 [Vitis vinifera]
MEEAKTMKTPMSSSIKLDKDEKGKSIDSTMYRGMISSLLYLTASRPDIMYSVCLCARFQSYPKESHLSVVKRILKYLKRTMDIGLRISANSGVDPSSFLHVQGFMCEPLSPPTSTLFLALAPFSMAPRQEPLRYFGFQDFFCDDRMASGCVFIQARLFIFGPGILCQVPTFELRIYESKVWPTIPVFEPEEVIQRICGLPDAHWMGKPSAHILIVIYRVFHHIANDDCIYFHKGTIDSNIIHRASFSRPAFTELTYTEIPQPEAPRVLDHAPRMYLSAQINSLGTHIEELVVRIDCIEDRMEHQHEEMMSYLHFCFHFHLHLLSLDD